MQEIPYRVRRSDRARRTRVTVTADRGVEVVVPSSLRSRLECNGEAAAAINELRPWVDRRLRELDLAREQLRTRPGTVRYLDDELQLVVESERRRVHRRGDRLLVPAENCAAPLERWYRRAARREIGERVSRHGEASGLLAGSVSIRAQRTRWGSCSPTGALSFNWRLMLAPSAVLDYVVWHELCHLAVRDHSPRFWQLLAEHCSDYPKHVHWLKRYGPALSL